MLPKLREKTLIISLSDIFISLIFLFRLHIFSRVKQKKRDCSFCFNYLTLCAVAIYLKLLSCFVYTSRKALLEKHKFKSKKK